MTSGSYVKCREQRLHAATPNIDMEHSLEPFKMSACDIAQHTDEVSVARVCGEEGIQFETVNHKNNNLVI